MRHVVTFGRVLREGGLEIGPGRIADALAGLDHVDLALRDDVYWTLRSTLVTRREEIGVFDRAFEAWFLRARRPLLPPVEQPSSRALGRADLGERDEAPGEAAEQTREGRGYSADELLRTKDFASLTAAELEQVRELIERIAVERPQRSSRRLRRRHDGSRLDVRSTIRESLASGGDPFRRVLRTRVRVKRRMVVICDVSGSMEAYARALLLFVHALRASGKGVEAFAFGTRLTRLTHDLDTYDPNRAVGAVAARVVDWSGGTRIGVSLKAYNDDWGRRGHTRGAVVIIASDGWERGENGAALVEQQMARLAREAYAVVWVNPLKGHPAYQPLAAGMRAALPHVDRFLPGHNVESLVALGRVLSGIERRHAA